MMKHQFQKKVIKTLTIFFVISTIGCTSYPLKVCVSNDLDNFTVSVCEDVYIEKVYLYHLDTSNNKNITDWSLVLSKDNPSFIKEITLGLLPSGFIVEKKLDSLTYNGEYFFDINTSRQSGGLILNIEDGKIISYEHDSTIDCCDELSLENS